MKKAKTKESLNIKEHFLVPKHSKATEKEKKDIIEKYNISLNELPKITLDDPAISSLDAKEGDIIRIDRSSETAGKTLFYRCVKND